MDATASGSRRAILKASVATIALAATGGALAACGESGPAKAEPAAAVPDPNPIVATKYGPVKGQLEEGIATFKGVRYGADTATTRFQPPKPPTPWTEPADALAYATSAPQLPAGDGGGLFSSWRQKPPLPTSEDCHFLNVWTPAADDKKRPVLVWFHGGGFDYKQARARNGLVGRDDDVTHPRRVVQRLQGDDHLDGAAVGVRDDPLGPSRQGRRVHLRHHEGDVGIHPPGARVVDDHRAALRRLRRELA